MNEVVAVWNAHRIRPSKNPNCPSGIPNAMFMVPQLWGTDDFKVSPSTADLQTAKDACTFLTAVPCDEDVFDLSITIMDELNLSFPNDRHQAAELYIALRDAIRLQMNG